MLRNTASGPEMSLPGRIVAGLLPGEHRNRPSGRFLCSPGSSPAKIRPGRPISGTETILRNIEYSDAPHRQTTQVEQVRIKIPVLWQT